MSLKEQLQEYADASKQRIPEDKRTIMDNATNALLAKEISKSALRKGDQVPNFTLSNAKNEKVNLSDILKEKNAVISFYRGGWCPYCNLELKALQQALPDFEKNNTQLIAISPEVPDKSLTTSEKNALTFEVLSDVDNQVAKDFGLVFKMPNDLQDLYHQFGLHVDEYNGNDDYELPMPATYAVNQNGEIVYDFVQEDYKLRAEPSEILNAIQNNK